MLWSGGEDGIENTWRSPRAASRRYVHSLGMAWPGQCDVSSPYDSLAPAMERGSCYHTGRGLEADLDAAIPENHPLLRTQQEPLRECSRCSQHNERYS